MAKSLILSSNGTAFVTRQRKEETAIAKIIQINIKTNYAEGDVNAYVIVGDPVTLVDTGTPTPESVQQLRDGLAAVGLSFQDVEQIIVTHMHLDHCGGVMAIQEEANAPILIHERAKSELTGGWQEFQRSEAFLHTFIEQCGAGDILNRSRTYRDEAWKNVHYVKDGDIIHAGGELFHSVYVPGHSQTDICLWNPRTGDAFVGDYLLKKISANAFISPPDALERERPKPLLQLRYSLNRARDLPWKTIYPGHGDPYIGHREVINQRFVEQHERCEQIRHLLQDEPHTVYELSCTMFPWLKGRAVYLGLSEIQGHLDLLQERGLISNEQQGKIVLYHANAMPHRDT